MATITPIVRTHVSNVTKKDVKYGWYPPHGLYVPARGCVVVDGDVMSLCNKATSRTLLSNDLANKRVKLAIEVVDQKGVGSYNGDQTVEIKEKKATPKPAPKPEVVKAQKEAEKNVEIQADKLEKIETGEAPVEPYTETFQDKTIEEMKPPVQDIFPPDAFPDSEAPTKKADVETVDMFGADAFADKTPKSPWAVKEKAKKGGKMDPAKKAAMLEKRAATIARHKAAQAAKAADTFGKEED